MIPQTYPFPFVHKKQYRIEHYVWAISLAGKWTRREIYAFRKILPLLDPRKYNLGPIWDVKFRVSCYPWSTNKDLQPCLQAKSGSHNLFIPGAKDVFAFLSLEQRKKINLILWPLKSIWNSNFSIHKVLLEHNSIQLLHSVWWLQWQTWVDRQRL
jgi:hypothetical protein